MNLYTVDSFTDKPFGGNPAAVYMLDKPIESHLMKQIAAEINYSETAFIFKEGEATYHLRWWTPTVEVDLCGHATLAAAKILYEYGHVPKTTAIVFNTRSGKLTAQLAGDKIELDFPCGTTTPTTADNILLSLVKGKPLYVGIDKEWCLIEVEDEQTVRALKPDFEQLKQHTQKIFIVTARSANSNVDFVSRVFAPAMGINEDPVTGAAHCYLSVFWGNKLGKKKLIGFQVSERTGLVECHLLENGRVALRGHAIIMSEIKQNWVKP